MSAQHRGPARELLSFRVGVQEFCIDIMAVREIRGWTPTTPLPHAPTYMRGVVNLRGAVLPIVDLSERLGLGAVEPTPSHVIIVTELGTQVIGLLVSAVCDILAVTEAAIQPTPDVTFGPARACLHGLLTIGSRMVGLLRIDQFVPHDALAATRDLQAA